MAETGWVVFGALLMIVGGGYAVSTATFSAQPELEYTVEPSIEDGHRYAELSAEGQALTREGVTGGAVSKRELPEAFQAATRPGASSLFGADPVYVVYDGTVYRVTVVNGSAGLEFSQLGGAYYDYGSLSPKGQAAFTEARSSTDGSAGLYKPAPDELGVRYIADTPGENTIYVSYQGEDYTLAVSHERGIIEELFYLSNIGLLIGSLLVGFGAMNALATGVGRRTAAVVGAGVVVLPSLVVHLQLLLVPAPRPVAMVPVSLVAGAGAAMTFLRLSG
jgi:hypothetical protein